jgi:tRNA wybutosine-synthesizing protein 1
VHIISPQSFQPEVCTVSETTSLLPPELQQKYRREKYQLLGKYSAVKKCRWLHKSLLNQGSCYKQKFYGIKSLRCLQLAPSLAHCTMRCLFCWRLHPSDLNIKINETQMEDWDDPSLLIDEAILAQKRILSGYKKHPLVDPKRYLEALNPRHVAISLAGEPTLYPALSELIRELHQRHFTTFLVSNGTVPRALQNLDEEPTQLYLSISAPDKNRFQCVCRPQISDAWDKLHESLELLSTFSCPTVIRMTLVRHVNLVDAEQYVNLIQKAEPTYIEPKGFVYVGASRQRLTYENMPTHGEIRHFGHQISTHTGYNIIDESVPSRVLLLSKLKNAYRLDSSL